MAKSKNLDHLYENIEDYFYGELVDDDEAYLELDDDFGHYLDYRATRKSSCKSRYRKERRSEASIRRRPDDWKEYKFG